MAEVLARLARHLAQVRDPDHGVELAPLRAAEAQVHGHRVRVAAGRGERVEQRDRPRARDERQRALRDHGDECEQREREQPELRVEHDGHRSERRHHHAGGQAVGQHHGHRAQRVAEPERAVDRRADREVDEQLQQPGGEQPADRPQRRQVRSHRLQQQRAGERVPAVGGEVGEVTRAQEALAAADRVDRDRREDDGERR
jgi:hypothetical protein